MKPGKHQSSKQRCHDLSWKVCRRAQSFVLRSCTMHELRNQHVSPWLVHQYVVNNYFREFKLNKLCNLEFQGQ